MIVAANEYGRGIFTFAVGMMAGYGGFVMDRWENRYTHGRTGGGRAMEHSRMDRIKSILLILMAVALLGVGIVGIQSRRNGNLPGLTAGDSGIAEGIFSGNECGTGENRAVFLPGYRDFRFGHIDPAAVSVNRFFR